MLASDMSRGTGSLRVASRALSPVLKNFRRRFSRPDCPLLGSPRMEMTWPLSHMKPFCVAGNKAITRSLFCDFVINQAP